MSRTFTLERDKRSIASLHKHSLLSEIGYLRPDELYLSELRHLGLYKPIIVTEDGYYISDPEYIDAAIQLGEEYVEVTIIKGASVNDLIRLINFEFRMSYRASKVLLYKTIKMLEQHLWNTEEGKKWSEEIEGDSIDQKIGKLVGYSGSLVAQVKSVGRKDSALLDRIDDPEGDMTISKAIRQLAAEAQLNEKKDNYADVRYSNLPLMEEEDNGHEGERSNEEGFDEMGGALHENVPDKKPARNTKPRPVKAPCDVELMEFHVGFGKYGDFTLDLSSGIPAILCNDNFAGNVSITAKQSNDIDEGVHFVMQSKDLGWSFQVIATRMSKLVKKEEVYSKQA
jgi:hypothetical protein